MGTLSSGSRGGRPFTADYDHRGGGSSGANSSAVSHYAAQLKSCEMRYTILRNELDNVAAEERQLNVKKTKINKGIQVVVNSVIIGVFSMSYWWWTVCTVVLQTAFLYQSMSLTPRSVFFPLAQLPSTCRTNATSSKPSCNCC
jgi:hypothetical protein